MSICTRAPIESPLRVVEFYKAKQRVILERREALVLRH